LAKFLSDTADTTVPRTFIFDNLNFEFATTKLTPESEQTVKELVAILKAYPSTEARLEGHTDNVGDAEANKKLSQDRADSVKSVMEASGIDAARVSATGYGQEKPRASNDTEEGRAQNRRLELVVVKK
jgi:outer membrane protein OmpA-like peptidoglycan-associated protein